MKQEKRGSFFQFTSFLLILLFDVYKINWLIVSCDEHGSMLLTVISRAVLKWSIASAISEKYIKKTIQINRQLHNARLKKQLQQSKYSSVFNLWSNNYSGWESLGTSRFDLIQFRFRGQQLDSKPIIDASRFNNVLINISMCFYLFIYVYINKSEFATQCLRITSCLWEMWLSMNNAIIST